MGMLMVWEGFYVIQSKGFKLEEWLGITFEKFVFVRGW